MQRPTPSTNSRLAFRVHGFDHLLEALAYAARGETGYNFFDSRGRLCAVLPYRELAERARELARRLAACGFPRGSRVALLAETSPQFILAFFACQYAGYVPVPLPLAMHLGSRGAYVQRLARMMAAARAVMAVGSLEGVAVLREAAVVAGVLEVVPVEALEAAAPAATDPRPLQASEPCYIQFSSGSTTEPRGVLVSHRALMANTAAIARHGVRLQAGDRCVSWLPLYHDMGLVGCCLTPVFAQISVDYLATRVFAGRPLLWLELLSRQQGTIAFSPTYGYELAVRAAMRRGGGEELDLRCWRVAGVGGEMIRPEVLDRFARLFAASGFDRRAFLPSYGLAEATLAVSFAPLGRGLVVDRVGRGPGFEREGLVVPAAEGEACYRFVRCGVPLPEVQVEVRDESGRPLPDRRVGRVFVRGPSVMDGYVGRPELTRRVLDRDGWLDTGDLGYRTDGELVITGRAKDLIVHGGRNLWPQDIEWAVERIEGVRRAAAFGVEEEERERVVVVAECRPSSACEALCAKIRGVVRREFGVEAEVLLVPLRTLAHTTSGKLSRATVREDYRRGRLQERARALWCEAAGKGTAVPA